MTSGKEITSTQKAKELFEKMNGFRITHAHRIKCAKIVCDEIIKCDMESICLNDGSWTHPEEFWTEVKTELDKLAKPKKKKVVKKETNE